MAEITLNVAVVTSSVTNNTCVVDETSFKVGPVADIIVFVAMNTFVVAEIIIKENVITSSVVRSLI